MNFRQPFFLVLLLGFLARVLFYFLGAEIYFNKSDFVIQGDTMGWASGFESILNSGVFNVKPGNDLGYFGRLPGYSFFLGIFYLLAGRDWSLAFDFVVWAQILLDVVSILLIHKISERLLSKNGALFASILYALYPFVIVWTPVAHTETVSVFLLLSGVWFLLKSQKKFWFALLSGFLIGFGALMRPQLILFLPFPFLFLVFNFLNWRGFFRKSILLGMGILFTYGLWPARNYFVHDKLVLTQELKGYADYWDDDVISFMLFTYSVKSEWEPQFTSIVENKPTQWPAAAYTSQEDSLFLDKAVSLCKTCGYGFSRWPGYYGNRFSKEESCSEEIEEIFTYLRTRQIEENPWNFYLIVPLQNLKKALFKTQIYNKHDSILASTFISFLFLYRSLLILLGLFGAILLWRKGNYFFLMILLFFLSLYLILCFGTLPQMRNIEMRYFLHADVLLIIPAAFMLEKIKSLLKAKFGKEG